MAVKHEPVLITDGTSQKTIGEGLIRLGKKILEE